MDIPNGETIYCGIKSGIVAIATSIIKQKFIKTIKIYRFVDSENKL